MAMLDEATRYLKPASSKPPRCETCQPPLRFERQQGFDRMSAAKETDAMRIWFRLIRLHGRMSAAVSEGLRGIGLSVPQCDVLTTLSEQEGLSQQHLAERLYVTKGNISGLIDRLAAAGYVERRSTIGDRRSHALFLTAEGRRIAEKGIAVQRRFVMATIGGLTDHQLGELEAALVAVRDRMRKTAEHSSHQPEAEATPLHGAIGKSARRAGKSPI
jgi:DNA-binding MarR family transcriptional regulator